MFSDRQLDFMVSILNEKKIMLEAQLQLNDQQLSIFEEKLEADLKALDESLIGISYAEFVKKDTEIRKTYKYPHKKILKFLEENKQPGEAYRKAEKKHKDVFWAQKNAALDAKNKARDSLEQVEELLKDIESFKHYMRVSKKIQMNEMREMFPYPFPFPGMFTSGGRW